MTTLAALIAELQSEVPAVDSVPTTAQYTQAVKDAVLEFSRRCGLGKWAELTIVSGTATYSLATDFMKMIMLESLANPDGLIISPSGLIPVSADWTEEWTIVNKTITFTPAPTYAMTRDYKYKAGWMLTGESGSEAYATMGDDEKQIVMLKAKQLATEKIANSSASSGGMKYSLGAVSVDNTWDATGTLTAQMFELHGLFAEACDRYNGAVGMS